MPQIASVEGRSCAHHGLLGGLLDGARHALVAAQVGQTSLEQDATKGAPKVLVEDGVDGRIERAVHVAEPEG
jgi:hypothetical protein